MFFLIHNTHEAPLIMNDFVPLWRICERVGESIRKITFKKDGKVMSETVSTISSDGRIMTNRTTNRKGEETTSVSDKQ